MLLGIQEKNAWAINVELEPKLSWQLYYEDNFEGVPENSTSGKKSAFSNRYEPDLKFHIESSRVAINGRMHWRVYRYFSEKDYDSTDRFYNIESVFKINPRTDLTLSASYNLNTNPERYFTQEEGVASGILVRKSQNITKSYDANYIYRLSPRSNLTLLFNYLTFFTRASSGSPVYSYGIGYDYMLSNKNTINLSLGYSNLKFNYTLAEQLFNYTLDTYSINTGLIHQFSETLKLDFYVGWYFTDAQYQRAIFKEDPATGEQVLAGTESVSSSTPGTSFNLKLEKKYYHATFTFTGSQSLYTDPETGQTYPTRNFTFSTSYDFSSKLRGTATWAFYNNKATAGDYNNRINYDQESNYSILQLDYRYKPNIDIVLGYSRAESKDQLINTKTIRNNVWLQCILSLPRPFVVR